MRCVNRTVQYFSEDDLRRGESLSPDQIVAFLEDFRLTFGPTTTDDLPLGWVDPMPHEKEAVERNFRRDRPPK